jgi:hypothetical protein
MDGWFGSLDRFMCCCFVDKEYLSGTIVQQVVEWRTKKDGLSQSSLTELVHLV